MPLTTALYRRLQALASRLSRKQAIVAGILASPVLLVACIVTALADGVGLVDRRGRLGPTPRLTIGVIAVLLLGSLSSTSPLSSESKAHQSTSRPEASAVAAGGPHSPTMPAGAPSLGSTPIATATLEPTPTSEPTATPVATPVVSVVEDMIDVSASKSTLNGTAGSYTWSDVSFGDQLAKIAWSAKAPATSSCSFKWRIELLFGDAHYGSKSISAGKSASGSSQFDSSFDSGSLIVTTTCETWATTLTSYAAPKYWNPWGFNFSTGSLIYNPPSDFCSYFDCIPSFWDSTKGYVVQCRDLTFSHSGGRQGACSYHNGVYRPLYKH